MDNNKEYLRRRTRRMDDIDRDIFGSSVTPVIECEPTVSKPAHESVSEPASGMAQDSELLVSSISSMSVTQRFSIFEPLGVGGFATVYRAQDKVLGRIVALKLPHLPLSLLPEVWRRRFVTELRASAALHHPNIVTVFDAGMDNQRCYLVSEFIAGRTLKRWLEEHPQPVDCTTAAEIVAQLADGVQHAHETHILHRDLKPSNILIDEAKPCGGLPFTPRITDFGMARFREADVTITQDGTVLGSPAYMSPEQALGQIPQLGPTTDVYSLGVILYQLVTGQTPLNANSTPVALQSVVNVEPRAPRQLRSDLPQDLQAICMNCLEKSPAQRYATAAELAMDLRRFLAGQPVVVRMPGLMERVWRWSKRHPARFSLIVTITLCVSAIVGLLVRHSQTVATLNSELTESNRRLASTNVSLRSALEDSQAAKLRAEAEEWRALETVYAYDINRAFAAWRIGDAAEVRAVVARYSDGPTESNQPDILSRSSLRGPEWHWLSRQFQRPAREIARMPHAIYRMVHVPQGNTIVVAGRDDLIRVVESTSGRTIHEWPAMQQEINGLAFSSDGRTLWTGGDDGTVKAWDFATRTQVLQFDAHPGHHVYEVLYDPERDWLITCGNEPVIRLWDARTGDSRGTLEGHERSIDVILLHPDGRRLFSCSTDFSVRSWDLESRSETSFKTKFREKVYALTLSNNGRYLAAGSVDGRFNVWDLEGNALRIDGKLRDSIARLRFDQSGERLFAVDFNGVFWEWSIPVTGGLVENPPPAHVWQDGTVKPYDVQISQDGQELMVARHDGRVFAYSLSPPEIDDFTMGFERARDYACLKGRTLLLSEDTELLQIDAWAEQKKRRVLDQSGPWHMIAVSPDESRVAARHRDGDVVVFRLSDGVCLFRKSAGSGDSYYEMSFSADGRWLAISNHAANRVEIVNSETGEIARHFDVPESRHTLFAPSGDTLAIDLLREAPGEGRELRFLDWPSGQIRSTCESRSMYVGTQAFSPDGRLFAVVGDRIIAIHEVSSGRLVHELFGHRGAIGGVTFSPDSQRLASAGTDTCVKLWHVSTGQQLLEFATPGLSRGVACRFTSDGDWLVMSSSDHTLKFVRLK